MNHVERIHLKGQDPEARERVVTQRACLKDLLIHVQSVHRIRLRAQWILLVIAALEPPKLGVAGSWLKQQYYTNVVKGLERCLIEALKLSGLDSVACEVWCFHGGVVARWLWRSAHCRRDVRFEAVDDSRDRDIDVASPFSSPNVFYQSVCNSPYGLSTG